jgi:hypothetical protein
LIEKAIGCNGGGVWRARMCELAGVAGPTPQPIASALTMAASGCPSAKRTRPSEAITSATCWMRRPPKRASSPPAIGLVMVAAA